MTKKGDKIDFATNGSIKAADLVGSKFVVYQESMFGLYLSEIGSFEVPGLHGHHLSLKIKQKNGVSSDL